MRFVYLKRGESEIQEDIDERRIKSEKQIRALRFLIENDEVMLSELNSFADVTSAVVKTLEKNGYVEIVKKEVNRNPFKNKDIARTENLPLTKEQQKAMNKIEGAINDKIFREFLIHRSNWFSVKQKFICN